MALIERDQAIKDLDVHFPAIYGIITGAVDDYLAYSPEVRVLHSAVTRAAIIHDHMVHRGVVHFSSVPGALHEEIQKLHVFLLPGLKALRFKKLDADHLSHNQPTQQVRNFRGQLPLDGIDTTDNFEAGYVFDEVTQQVLGVYVVCPNGKRNYWEIELGPNGLKDTATVVDLFPPKPPTEEVGKVKPKEVDTDTNIEQEGDER